MHFTVEFPCYTKHISLISCQHFWMWAAESLVSFLLAECNSPWMMKMLTVQSCPSIRFNFFGCHQAHVRGHQVRKSYRKVVWTVGIVEKIILRWRRKRPGLRGFQPEKQLEGPSQTQPAKAEDEYDFLHDGRRQAEARMQRSLARVHSMSQYPEAREQYHRLTTCVAEMKQPMVWYEYSFALVALLKAAILLGWSCFVFGCFGTDDARWDAKWGRWRWCERFHGWAGGLDLHRRCSHACHLVKLNLDQLGREAVALLPFQTVVL